ncbi:MAG: hypothetical protein AB1631_06290 [Acidobacteriota bacterium]
MKTRMRESIASHFYALIAFVPFHALGDIKGNPARRYYSPCSESQA